MSKKSDLEDKLNARLKFIKKFFLGTVCLLGAVTIYSLVDGVQNKKDKLYNEVMIKANINKDKETDHNEWEAVYESRGLIYNMDSSNPKKDLSNRNMRKYLGRD